MSIEQFHVLDPYRKADAPLRRTPLTVADVRLRCEGAKDKPFPAGPGFIAACPCCDSRSRHLAVHDKGNGYWTVSCVKGCPQEAILAALSLDASDMRVEDPTAAPGRPPRPPTVEYRYEDADGGHLFTKRRDCRWKDGGWKKDFVQLKPDGTYGVASLGERSKVLYRLPEVLPAVRRGETIYVNEGEKACEALRSLGAVATCQPAGAGKGDRLDSRWLPLHTEALRGARRVVVVADRDAVGEAYARHVAAQLADAVDRVEVVQSATAGEKDDAWDHVHARHALDALVPRPDLLPVLGLAPKTFGEAFDPVELTHLVEPYLPRGKCVLFDADGGTGKTTMAVAWAAALSRGLDPITFQPLEGGPVKTLYLHKGEDGCDEIETVYRANRGVPGMIAYVDEENAPGLKFDAAGLRLLRDTIRQGGYGLVVVDALFYFLEGMVGDGYAAMDVIGVLQAMTRVATQTGATFWNIRHTVKGSIGQQASNLGMGSVQFRNSHRGQLVARRHPEKPGVVIVTDEKGSLLNPRGDHFAYRRIGLEVQYLVNEPNPFDKAPVEERVGKLDAAKAMLRDELTGRWVYVKEIESLASSINVSVRTLNEARRLLGVQTRTVAEGAKNRTYLHLPSYAEKDPYEDE